MFLRTKALMTILLCSCFFLACSKSESSSPQAPSRPSSSDEGKNSNNGEKPVQIKIPTLQVYRGSVPVYNEFNIPNPKAGDVFYDFQYQPARNEQIWITTFQRVVLIDCEDKDVVIQPNIYPTDSNGQIDLTRSLGLGYSPTSIFGGEKYIVRMKLNLKKSCLGLAYKFAVRAD